MKKILIILSVIAVVVVLGIVVFVNLRTEETGTVVVKVDGTQNLSGWKIKAYKVLEDKSRKLLAEETTGTTGEATFSELPIGIKVDFITTPVAGFVCMPIMEHLVDSEMHRCTVIVRPIVKKQ
jgi:hypothetical protein